MRRTRPGAAPRHRSVFLHMPKCGGTSLSEAMYATVPLNQRIGVIDAVSTRRTASMLSFGEDSAALCHEDLEHGQLTFDLREKMLLQHMAWDTMLIHGHVLWSTRAERHFGNAYKYVTILRDPVARTVSNFRMMKRNGLLEDDFDAYLEGPVARRHARVYLRYLAGANDIAENEVSDALALAHARLSQMALVGFLDRMDRFLEAYRALFGVRLSPARLNTAPDRPPEHTPAQIERIHALCAPDIAIFEAARTRS
ncbi:sulfotransferase family 2 domain-containing protein [Jannaschia faecimaris]|nr:sulfotransferase family 2 domain-containing protein [Jannaschia faecimaris]